MPRRQLERRRTHDPIPRLQRPAQRVLVTPRMLGGAEAHGLLVALAADDHHVTRAGYADGVQDGALAVGDAEEISAFHPSGSSQAAVAVSAIISARSSVRGSSAVTTVTSACRAATSPIRWRFSRSRNPAEPNTTMTPPAGPRQWADSFQCACQGVGRVREIDDCRETLARNDAFHPTRDVRRSSYAGRDGRWPNPQRERRPHRGQDVGHVEGADERGDKVTRGHGDTERRDEVRCQTQSPQAYGGCLRQSDARQ